MRNPGLVLLVLILALSGGGYFLFINKKAVTVASPPAITVEKKETVPEQKIMPLTISSPAFKMNGVIPALFTCDGKNISPELFFSNVPAGTQSLALTMEDPDVPKSIRTDGMWNHWVVWNIPSTTTSLKEGATPPGVLGMGTNRKASYLGPCPPDREHRYIFTLFALDSLISLPPGSTKEQLLQALAPHIIEKAELIGRYNRN